MLDGCCGSLVRGPFAQPCAHAPRLPSNAPLVSHTWRLVLIALLVLVLVLRETECCALARTNDRSVVVAPAAARPQLKRRPLGGRPQACLPIEENEMRRYHQVSGAFFCLLAAVQLTRVVLRWPVQVADMAVPLWASVLAFLVTTAFAIWAFRTAKGAQWSAGHGAFSHGATTMAELTRADVRKAVRIMWVGGTLGALFAAISRSLPLHVTQAVRTPNGADLLELVIRYGYLAWLLTYFFVTHFRIDLSTDKKDLWYDVIQSVVTLAAAFLLGFVAPADGLPYGLTVAIVSANVAVLIIAALAIRLFPSEQPIRNLRLAGALCAAGGIGLAFLPIPRFWDLAAVAVPLVGLWVALLKYRKARLPAT